MDGRLSVPQILQQVLSEGAVEAVVVTDQPENYGGVTLPSGVAVHHRSELDAIQRRLRDTPGVTVLVYDQTCAAEKRRRRKKNKPDNIVFPDPPRRMVINPAVCEGCGDCGVQSNCLSILPLETPLGRKRQIDQASCNKDYSCAEGFCPSFVSVIGGQLKKPAAAALELRQLESMLAAYPLPPSYAFDKPFEMLVAGVGGTGVVTVGALITMAAHLEGKGASTLDFMGFAQKGGAVMSHVRVAPSPRLLHQVRIDLQQADALLACDLVVAAMPDALAVMRRGHTRVVANENETPTAEFTRDPDADIRKDDLLAKIQDAGGPTLRLNAQQVASSVLGDPIGANILMMGAAWQLGLVPVGLAALNRAIELNGVAVEMNKKAFMLGRLVAADEKAAARLAQPARVVQFTPPSSLEELVAFRADWLMQYQDAAYARQYRAAVARDEAREVEIEGPASKRAVAKAVARSLFKVMAYKDEYEVARLHTQTGFLEGLKEQFEGDFRVEYHLAPPLLARKKPGTDVPAKMRLGPWMRSAFRMLAPLKVLRGTAFDVFGYTHERRAERRLRSDYLALFDMLATELTLENRAAALKLAQVAESIRGYGHVKAANLERARAETARLLQAFKEPMREQMKEVALVRMDR